ncbi:TPA: hypothetical protein ACH3X1_006345 [Trebouxia sp. C0004]
MGDFDKSRKIAFLPGTSGVGKALAKNLAKAGYKILIGGAKLGEAKASVKEIQKAAGSACPFIEAMDMKGAAGAAKVIFFAVSGSQEEKKDLLQDLQSELKGKTIIDVTTAAYLKDESKWGQTSTTHMNREALAVPAKWVRCWNTVFVGLLENPPPSDSPHNIIICGDDQDAVTDAKQLTDCQPGFKVGSYCLALQHDSTCKMLQYSVVNAGMQTCHNALTDKLHNNSLSHVTFLGCE